MSRDRFFGYLMILAALVMLGSSFVAAKAMIETVPKFLALAIRLGAASLILAPVLLARERRLPALDTRGWGLLILQGLVGVVLFNLFLFHGLERTTAGCAGVTFGMLPIFVGLLSWIFLRERMTGLRIAALACAAVGTIQLNIDEVELSLGLAALLGNMLIVAAVCCEGGFTILGKHLTGRCSPLSLAALVSMACLVMVLPLAVRDAIAFDFTRISMGEWMTLGWWALASGVGYFFLFYAGLARVEASSVGVLSVAMPVTTLLLSQWLLHEPIGLTHIVGIVCAAAGILMILAQPSFDLRMMIREKRFIPHIGLARFG